MSHQISAERRTTLLGLVCLLGSISPGALWADERKLRVITEEWAPFNFTEDGVLKGFSVEVLQSMLDKLDLKIPIEIYPSMRLRSMLSNTLVCDGCRCLRSRDWQQASAAAAFGILPVA